MLSQLVMSLIVARTENNVIGCDNGMPWHLPGDLQRFKSITLGKPVIMGRKTYASIGRPLTERTNIVMTRSKNFMPTSGVIVARSFEQAQDMAWHQAKKDGVDEFFVIGGAEIFKLALGRADRLYLTEILATIAGDTFFAFEPKEWRVVTREDPVQGKKDTHPTRFVIYEKL